MVFSGAFEGSSSFSNALLALSISWSRLTTLPILNCKTEKQCRRFLNSRSDIHPKLMDVSYHIVARLYRGRRAPVFYRQPETNWRLHRLHLLPLSAHDNGAYVKNSNSDTPTCFYAGLDWPYIHSK